MIRGTLELLVHELNNYLNTTGIATTNPVVIENVADTDDSQSTASNAHILLTLVNIEEETSLKNGGNYYNDGSITTYSNPPVHLNIFLLFSINNTVDYREAISHLSNIVAFFQGKNVFNHQNTPDTIGAFADNAEYKFMMHMHSVSMQDFNNLWSSFGGKARPFVMYKLRLLEVNRAQTLGTGSVISTISLNKNTP